MAEITFSNPGYLWFLLSLPVLFFTHSITFKRYKQKALNFANFEAISRVTGGQFIKKNLFLLVFRMIILSLIVFAVAGTTFTYLGRTLNTDYVMAIDTSASMFVQDVPPDRLTAAKQNLISFLDIVPTDTEAGLVSFSGIVLIKNKITNDFNNVKQSIAQLVGSTVDGTDIGGAIVTATNMLVSKPGDKSKVILLITDGQSNVGIPLEEAIKYANDNKIIVNTLGLGTKEGGAFLGTTLKSTLDEASLIEIAARTGGSYFKAETQKDLEKSFKEISRLIRKKISINLSFSFTLIILLLLLAEWVLINTKNKIIF
ncbi:VWA domain-containing protein [Candidatus Woesearchaeota archaeon]|nr:VWA domain-containing protein [Candidatus Woesearchaeota archaeon]